MLLSSLVFACLWHAPCTTAHATFDVAPPKTTTEAVAKTIVVTGTVYDQATARGVGGVQITAGGTAATSTASDGRYTLRLPSTTRGRTLAVTARATGYQAVTVNRQLTADTILLDIVLPAAPTPQRTALTDATASKGIASVAGNRAIPAIAAVPYAPSYIARESARRAAQDRRIGTVAPRPHGASGNTESEQYAAITDNPFLTAAVDPLSTFSIDVDRASYANVRRFLTQGQTPPSDAVRIEELVNYFPYTLPAPSGDHPVRITTETMAAPWQPAHQLVRIALQARRIDTDALPPSNLVFLIDVSGSMQSPDKLPLVKQSLRLLVDQLRAQDRVAIVVYAGAAGLVLPSTAGTEKAQIVEALERLEAGGSTAGGAGLELAYRVAREHFRAKGNNRVILATDGDFNVGPSSDADMVRLITRKRAEGTYLTILGFGTGNYQDSKMQQLAKHGNGNAAYVDDIAEARKVLVQEMGATLVTVANDVKLQVAFNPAQVKTYRLIGYEDRLLTTEDFANDRKDAGDLGAGHSVTALYEVVPTESARSGTLLDVRLRYKQPGHSESRVLTQSVSARPARGVASADFRFAASVAAFGMILRNSPHQGTAQPAMVLALARSAVASDEGGYRAEFVRLLECWTRLDDAPVTSRERR